MKRKILVCVFIASLLLVTIGISFGWDDKETHPRITEKAIEISILDSYLKNNLSITEGKEASYNGKMVIDLIKEGSTHEDNSDRAFNHFHNPIEIEGNEGLQDQGCGWLFPNYSFWAFPSCDFEIFSGLPNRDWAIGQTRTGSSLDECGAGDHSDDKDCNDYSWRRARETCYEALIASSKGTRDSKFIEFYEKLGRILHLLQDVAVPAHTRNDMFGHLDYTRFAGFNFKSWGGNLFEYWVQKKLEEDSNYVSRLCPDNTPTLAVFTKPGEYWDRDVYKGAGPEGTLPIDGKEQSGLAEYSNANFLSRFTIFTEDLPCGHKHYFPYPRKDSIEDHAEVVTGEDGEVDVVKYGRKYRHGEVIDHFVKQNWFWERLSIKITDLGKLYQLGYQLDDKVHEAYAEKLIPKAVGYTAGLINYFFRGQIEITPPDRYVYAIIDGSVTPNQFTSIKAKVRNATPNEQMGEGELTAVARYRIWNNYSDDLLGQPPSIEEMKNTDYSYSVSQKITITSLDSVNPQEYEFDFSTSPIPVGIVDLQFFVIFKGTLGNETDNAVAVGRNDLSEPTHVMIANSTDRVYLCDAPAPGTYTLDQIANDPILSDLVDMDDDGHYCGQNGNQCDCYADPFILPVAMDSKLAFYPSEGKRK